jgi:Glycosyl hydrolase family 20, catalytic domain/beta-acetyl hexosaminidase like
MRHLEWLWRRRRQSIEWTVIPLSLLLVAVVVAVEPYNDRWSQSKIWPAVTVEQFSNDAARETSGSATATPLAMLYKDDWALDTAAFNGRLYPSSASQIVETARTRLRRSFERGIPRHFADHAVNPNRRELTVLLGVRLSIDNLTATLHPFVDESYQITVHSPSPWIEVHATTVYGARHGMETIAQLFTFAWMDPTGRGAVFMLSNASLYIEDAPVYSYRGLLIDTGRHYLPLQLILTNLEVMAANKLNVLHWHLTDAESWPYQSTTFPELSQHGAYCPECIYTASDIAVVVQYAAVRGIRVVPEFDLPSHAQGMGTCWVALANSHLPCISC